jgi:ankyrin repeat protein
MNSSILSLFLLTFFCLFSHTLIAQDSPGARDTSYYLISDNDFNLILSAERGHYDNVKSLLIRGQNVNAATAEGVTSLMYAADRGDSEMVKLLMEYGADVDIQPYTGLTALMSAAINNHLQVAELLIQSTDSPDSKDMFGVTALHFSAAYNHPEMVEMLLFYGADIEASDHEGNTPLISASYNNCIEAAEILIEKGAKLNAADRKSFTPLMTAIQQGNSEIVDILIRNGADIHYSNEMGLSPVVLAIKYGNSELVEELLEKGAAINQQGKTIDVFELAKQSGKDEITDILMTYEVKPSYRPDFGKIAIGPSISFNLNDFSNGLKIGIHDSKYNIGLNSGFSFRPSAVRVINNPEADTLYQYWERRYFFQLGIEKRFSLINKEDQYSSGLIAGVNEYYTYGSFRGSHNKAQNRFVTAPQLGWYFLKGPLMLQFHFEYLNLKIDQIKPGRLSLSALYLFPIKRKLLTSKKIVWLTNQYEQ